MAIDSNVLQEVVDALKQDPEIKNNVYQATVSRIDGEGVVWVNIAGSDTETPTAITSAEVAPGDAVNVEWRNNKLYIGGNYSNPSAGVVRVANVEQIADVAVAQAARAQTAAVNAETYAQDAKATADAVHGIAVQAAQDASDAKTAAGTAQTAADSALVGLSTVEDVVGVLNWITAHGTMTLTSDVTVNPAHVYFVVDAAGDYVVGGTHYSVVAEPDDADLSTYYELTVDESVQNYVATHIVVDTEGLWIIPDSGGNKVLIATGNGSTYTTAGTYIVGTGNVVLASFTASGAQIGQNANGQSRSVISTNGMQVVQNVSGSDVQIVNLGYGSGTDIGGGTSDAPYYTLGIRDSGSSVGNYSVAEGNITVASGYAAHAEGYGGAATGVAAHKEGGLNVLASGDNSHAEGGGTTASGLYSHAEGRSTKAQARWSHSQNYNTIATKRAQTVLGKYNEAETGDIDENGTYAVILGNGTADNARSNALTVDWSGNVEAAGGGVFGDDVSVTGDVTATGDIMAVGMAGMIQMFAGSTAPTGWLMCDGSVVSRTTYATLFSVIGTTYGSGDGSTTFKLPDLRGRTPIGVNDSTLPNGRNQDTTGLSERSRGTYDGKEKVTLTVDQMPSHHHDVTYAQYNRGTGSATASALQYTGYTKQTSDTGGGQAHENMQPFAIVNFIICTGKF